GFGIPGLGITKWEGKVPPRVPVPPEPPPMPPRDPVPPPRASVPIEPPPATIADVSHEATPVPAWARLPGPLDPNPALFANEAAAASAADEARRAREAFSKNRPTPEPSSPVAAANTSATPTASPSIAGAATPPGPIAFPAPPISHGLLFDYSRLH